MLRLRGSVSSRERKTTSLAFTLASGGYPKCTPDLLPIGQSRKVMLLCSRVSQGTQHRVPRSGQLVGKFHCRSLNPHALNHPYGGPNPATPQRYEPELEHFHKCCSDAVGAKGGSGLFGFWLRFGSVTGPLGHASSPKPRQKPKILAPHRYIISVNALMLI